MSATLRRIAGLVALVFLALATADAAARPGGGSSFSGRSSSSSSSGSSYRSGSSTSGSSYRSGSSTTSSTSGSSYRSGSSTTSSTSGSSYRSGSTTSSSTTSSSGASRSWGGSTWAGSSTSASSTSSSSSSGSDRGEGSPGSSSSADEPPPDRSFGGVFFVFFALALLVVLVIVLLSRRKRNAAWETMQRIESEEAAARVEADRTRRYASIDKALGAIKAKDDGFSYVLFEDFLYTLYAEVHAARGAKGGLERLAPYLSATAIASYRSLPKHALEAVVIGGMRVEEVAVSDDEVTITAVFTANVSERDRDQARPRAWFMEEIWTLVRKVGVKSRPPSRARVIGCPSCGAPLDKIVGGTCGYCNTTAASGASDWFVERIEIASREERGPMLTGTTEEVGTDLPTVVAKNAKQRLEKLRKADPAFSWTTFVSRVEATFAAFHASWSAQDLRQVRPYLSDNLFELQRYWVDAYKAQGLKNLTADAKVVTVHLARVMSDKYFHAITVRVFASCRDYTVDGKGAVVGGSRDKVREYSEYWTFLRGVGATGAAPKDGACPSCGAAFATGDGGSAVNMSGTCTHCDVKITSGEFDWVLSRIEQDEVYEVAA